MLVDSHAHLIASSFEMDLEEVLSRARQAGVEAIINICTTPEELAKGLELAAKHAWIYTAAATTPHDVEALTVRGPTVIESAAVASILRACQCHGVLNPSD